ncbi:MAG TPA: DUF1634 domain-containing protein [Puia sp.]|nr:DUF1634 domain-containing protein [Puia sp.]
MRSFKHQIRDRDIEKIMGNLLRYGVLTSALVVIIGAIFYLIQHGQDSPQYRKFVGEPERITDLKEVWRTAMHGNGRSIIQIGLFILIATPIARIIFSVFGYLLEKDFLYVVITLIVLGIILHNL